MGVYIPNMEKPKDCEVCPFFVLDGAITDDNEWVSYSVCDLLSKTIGDADMMNDCPLIEIVTCSECKHLEVINGAKIYAHCPMWEIDFKPFEDDTRTNYCSWGERKEE